MFFEKPVMDLESAKLEIVKEFNETALKTGRMSDVLITQLANHSRRAWEIYKVENRLKPQCYDIGSIKHTIQNIEEGEIRNVKPFRKDPLKGLFKAHHIQASFMHTNMRLELEKTSEQDFSDMCKDRNIDLDKGWLTKEECRKLAHLGTIDMLKKRKNPTGEWVVLAKHELIHYYLCLALHDEDDNNVYARAKLTLAEFPDLQF